MTPAAKPPGDPADRTPSSCAACGGARIEMRYRDCVDRCHWTPGRFSVARCTHCGLGWTVPMPTAEELEPFYPTSYVSFQSAGGSRAPSPLRALLRMPYRARFGTEERIPRPPREHAAVLDVGCGTGVYLEQLADAGWEVWGLEPNAGAAGEARRRLGVGLERVVAGHAEEASFPEGAFDLVTMVHVLEHLHDPAAVLAKAHSWLRPGGVLRLWLPNAGSVEARLFGRLWFGLDVPRHLYHFSRPSLRGVLERTGFRVERLVPEFEASSLAGSLALLGDALTDRRRSYRHSQGRYLAVLPVAAVLRSLGAAASLDCTARKGP